MSTPALPRPRYAVDAYSLNGLPDQPLRTFRDPAHAAVWFFRLDRPQTPASVHIEADGQAQPASPGILLTHAYRSLGCLDDARPPVEPRRRALLDVLESAQVNWFKHQLTHQSAGHLAGIKDIGVRDWRRAGHHWGSLIGSAPRSDLAARLGAAFGPGAPRLAVGILNEAVEDVRSLTAVVDELATQPAHDPAILRMIAGDLQHTLAWYGAGTGAVGAALEWCLDRLMDLDSRTASLIAEFSDRPAAAQQIREEARRHLSSDTLLDTAVPRQGAPGLLEPAATGIRATPDPELPAFDRPLSDAQAATRWRERVPQAQAEADTHQALLATALRSTLLGTDIDLLPFFPDWKDQPLKAAEEVAARTDRRHAMLGHLDHLADLRGGAQTSRDLEPYLRQAEQDAATAIARLAGHDLDPAALRAQLLNENDHPRQQATPRDPRPQVGPAATGAEPAPESAGPRAIHGDAPLSIQRTLLVLDQLTDVLAAAPADPLPSWPRAQATRNHAAHADRYPHAPTPSRPAPAGSEPGPRTAEWQRVRTLLLRLTPAALPPRAAPAPAPTAARPKPSRTSPARPLRTQPPDTQTHGLRP